MHVLLIHQAFAAIHEPGGTRHHELALHMARNNHRVTVISSPISYLTGEVTDDRPDLSGHELIKIIRPPVFRALHRSFFHRVLNFISFMVTSFWWGLKVRNVDIVWGTSPPIFQGVTAWLLSWLKGVPFLFEIRDLWPAFAIAVGVLKNKFLIRSSQALERVLYRKADQLVVNSPGFIQHVASLSDKPVVLVPNGSDVDMFDPECRGLNFRAQHHLEGKFIVLYAGAHGLSNDLTVLLEAADRLRDVESLAFVLVGDGKEKPNLVHQSLEMGLTNIFFISPVPKDQIPEVLGASDVCIAILKPIELYKTVYPNKVFDYMAAGRPIVLAIDGVIREVIETAQAGIAVPPGNPGRLADAIQMYQEKPQVGKTHGDNGRQYVRSHFERKILSRQMLDILLKTLENYQ